MIASNHTIVGHAGSHFSYSDACNLAEQVKADADTGLVVIELSRVEDTSTAALARLVLLRRELLRSNRDLRISGLVGRALNVFAVNRLEALLPTVGTPQ
jgi:anti-anti-sigma regulatory factor